MGLSIINYINETVFNICAETNGIYFISHNSFAFNHKLNEILFWKDKIYTDRKGLKQLAFDFIENIRYQTRWCQRTVSKMNNLNDNSGLKVGFCNVNWLHEEKSKEDMFLRQIQLFDIFLSET